MSELVVNLTEDFINVEITEQLTATLTEDVLSAEVTTDGLVVTITDDVLSVTFEGDLAATISEDVTAVSLGEVVEITNNYGSDTVAVTAATNLSGNRIVTVEGNYADKDTTTDKFKVLGMTTGAATTGSEATVQVSGYITEAGWNFTVGSPVFLSTNGHITQTAPTSGFRMIVGRPKTATTLFLDFSEPIITV